MSELTAWAILSVLRLSSRIPVLLCCTTSTRPPTGEAMTGIFIRINSMAAMPNASRLLGTTAISKALITSAGFLHNPVKVTFSFIPS